MGSVFIMRVRKCVTKVVNRLEIQLVDPYAYHHTKDKHREPCNVHLPLNYILIFSPKAELLDAYQ